MKSAYVEVEHLGEELTKGDEHKIWDDIRKNQQRILEDKRIKHRNFGIYSKHNCGYDTCVWNGIMVRQGSWLADSNMHFDGDNNRYLRRIKSEGRKGDRKKSKQIIDNDLDND